MPLLIATVLTVLTFSLIVSAQTLSNSSSCPALTRTLQRESRGTDVTQLQNFLISKGYLSSDSATGYFGSLTEAGVQKFQCAQSIVCSGNPSSTGYGLVGAKTRAAIQKSCSTTTSTSSTNSTLSLIEQLNAQIRQLQERIAALRSGTSASSPSSASNVQPTPSSQTQQSTQTTQSTQSSESAVPNTSTPTTQTQATAAAPTYGNVTARLGAVEAKRAKDWTRYGTTFWPYWEVVWDGSDSPADNVPSPFLWDNPIDDDWFDPFISGYGTYLDQFRLNTPSRGFMTVDRTYKALNKTGSIYRRDEFLDTNTMHALYGLTLEVKVKLLPQSNKDAFNISYVANDCTSNVALSGATALSQVGLISTGSIYGNHSNHIAFDTTSDFVTLRLVRAPNATTFTVYLVVYANEGDQKPAQYAKLIEGACLPEWRVGSGAHVKYPYIQIGDNSGATDSNAAYILDFVRYRRDAYTPAETLSSIQDRRPLNTLPNHAPSGGDSYLFGSGYWGSVSGGYLSNPPVSGEVSNAKGLADMGNMTVEIRAKVLPNHSERGWKFQHIDTLGGLALYLSPNKVELGPGSKPVGIQSYAMDTTDTFHTYRIVRKAGEIYAHLYVDNDPVPKIVDQHLSAETEARGYAANPNIVWGATTYYPAPFMWPVRATESHLEIDYIRWHGYAFAPPR